MHFLENVSNVLPHLLCDVSILVQGEGSGVMPQVPLKGLHIVPGPEGGHGEAVPLRYNYDKPEESRNIKGFQGFKPDF